MKKKTVIWAKYIFLIVLSVISVFPLWFMFVSSFNSSVEVLSGKLLPGTSFMANAEKLFGQTIFLRSFLNSLKYTVVGTAASVLICGFAGYAFEVYHDRAKDGVMFVFLMSIMVPAAATLVPMFLLYSKLHLLNTTLGFILPSFSTALLVMLFRQSARSFPRELIDAARIDGLGEGAIFLRIFFPVMRSTFACAVIITVMNIWNDYLWGLVVLQSQQSRTIQVFLASLNDGYSIDYGVLMMGITLSTLPIALVFFFLQKTFVQSVAGSIK